MRRLKAGSAIVPTAIALAIAVITLADLFVDEPLLNTLGAHLVNYGVIIAAFALLIGVANLLGTHLRSAQAGGAQAPYSALLLGTTVALIAWGLLVERGGSPLLWWLRYVIVPLQSSFFALLAFFILGVAYRALHRGRLERLLFVLSAAIVIVGLSPLAATYLGPAAMQFREGWLALPVMAGARGLLLGIALGTIATGLRLLFDGRHYFK